MSNKFRKEIVNNDYEQMGDGRIFLPKSKVAIGGVFTVEHIRDGEVISVTQDNNIVVDQGLDYVLGTAFDSGVTVPITSFYLGIFEGNYTPLSTDTAANITANSTESTAYDEANRPAWTHSTPVTGQSIDNLASKATFTINATKVIYGAFLVSSNVKSGTAGTLVAASRFAASRSVVATDQLLVGYQIAAQDVV